MVGIKPPSQQGFGGFRQPVLLSENLSKGIEIGKAMGEAAAEAKIIITMHNNGFTAEQIAAATDKDIKDVEAITEIS